MSAKDVSIFFVGVFSKIVHLWNILAKIAKYIGTFKFAC
jgi:hypothetical protein